MAVCLGHSDCGGSKFKRAPTADGWYRPGAVGKTGNNQKIWLNPHQPEVIYWEVKLAKQIFALGMVAFWSIMANHCALEVIPSLSFIACSTDIQAEATQHLPTDCGDEGDVCATVEGGNYRSEENPVLSQAPNVAFAFVRGLLSEIIPLQSLIGPALPELVPPEFGQTWQFSLRTALAPRAPSLLS